MIITVKIRNKCTRWKLQITMESGWGKRWFTFDIDFEMYGKDLTESSDDIINKICKSLGKSPPNGFAGELFLTRKENFKI